MLFGAAVVITWLGLWREPMAVSQEIAALYPERENSTGLVRNLGELVSLPGVLTAMMAMMLAAAAITMITDFTSLYIVEQERPLSSISLVFSAHTLGMFAFSVLSGKLVDSLGHGPVILAGTGLMFTSLVMASVSSAVIPLAAALFLLGLGWNLCFVGGSALLADHLTSMESSRTQRFNDLMIGMVSAIGSLGSGVIFASMGFVMVTVVGVALVVIILAVTVCLHLSMGA